MTAEKQNLNKKEVINEIAIAADITKAEAETYLNAVVSVYEDIVIERKQGAQFGKLGSFRLVDRAAREFPHINSDGVTVKPARKNIKFNVNDTTQKRVEEETAE